MMVASPADVLIQFLVVRGVAFTPPSPTLDAWPIVNGVAPIGSENYLSVMDYGNLNQGRLHNIGKRIAPALVQIMIRSIDQPSGWAKGQQIQAELDAIGVPVANGGLGLMIPIAMPGETPILQAVHIRMPINPLGQEKETNRYLYSINVQMAFHAT